MALSWQFDSDASTYKVIKVATSNFSNIQTTTDITTLLGVKYDGAILTTILSANSFTLSDQIKANTSAGYVYLSISDTNTGWLEAWDGSTIFTNMTWANLTVAYMNGWKLTTANVDVASCVWTGIVSGTTKTGSSGKDFVIANKDVGYTSYKIHYKLAQKIYHVNYVDDLSSQPIKSPGSVVYLPRTQCQVEQRSGIQWREIINPQINTLTGYYMLNEKGSSSYTIDNPFIYKPNSNIQAYKDNKRFVDIVLSTDASNQNSINRWYILAKNFDPTSIYTVTYEMLDKYNYTVDNGIIVNNPIVDYAYSYQHIDTLGHQNIGYFSFKDAITEFTNETKRVALKESGNKVGNGSLQGLSVFYDYVPYQGVISTISSAVLLTLLDKGFMTTYGTGKPKISNSYNRPIPITSQLPIALYDYNYWSDSILASFTNNTVISGFASVFSDKGVLLIERDSTSDSTYKKVKIGDTVSSFSVGSAKRGYGSMSPRNPLAIITSYAIPTNINVLTAGAGLVLVNNEIMLFVCTSNRKTDITLDGNTDNAFDVFKLSGRHLIKSA